MSLCVKCGSEFNLRKLEGKNLKITSEQNIVDEDGVVVGCRSCLGVFIKDYAGLISEPASNGRGRYYSYQGSSWSFKTVNHTDLFSCFQRS